MIRICKDTTPRYTVQGVKSLQGVSFPTRADAAQQIRIARICKLLATTNHFSNDHDLAVWLLDHQSALLRIFNSKLGEKG